MSTRIEEIEGDEYPIWHTNKYSINEDEIEKVLDSLKYEIKKTWYLHAYNDKNLYVVFPGKIFKLPAKKDSSHDEMIEYGVNVARMDRHYLENIPVDL